MARAMDSLNPHPVGSRRGSIWKRRRWRKHRRTEVVKKRYRTREIVKKRERKWVVKVSPTDPSVTFEDGVTTEEHKEPVSDEPYEKQE